jgi:hypothetical protein
MSRFAKTRVITNQAQRHFFAGLMILLPGPGESWTAAERDDWLALCRYLVDWLIVVADDEPRAAE